MVLKEQVEVLLRENSVLKRAVAIQHDRQKEYEEKSQELQHLKQLVSQYQEQVRTLEVLSCADSFVFLIGMKRFHITENPWLFFCLLVGRSITMPSLCI